ncbi:MAG: hypothetical protein RL097_255 [Candidatus Parcubacteria bacterium]
MAYTTNPKIPKVRRDAVRLVYEKKWSIRKVAKHLGCAPSTVSRWCKNDPTNGRYLIPTKSSVPMTSPKALPRETVEAIIKGNGEAMGQWGQGQLICDLCGLICGHESPSISISAG